METKLPPNITTEMVAEAKQKHGDTKVKILDLFIDNESLDPAISVLALVPTSRIRNEYLRWVDKNPNKAEEVILKACIISDIDKVMADDKLRVAAFDGITQMLPSGKAVIKNV
jgi:hypothetical protein